MTRASRSRRSLLALPLLLALSPVLRADDPPETPETRAWDGAFAALTAAFPGEQVYDGSFSHYTQPDKTETEAEKARRRAHAQALLEECVARFPASSRVSWALHWLARCCGTSPAEVKTALGYLRRLQTDFPESTPAAQTGLIERLAGFRFSVLQPWVGETEPGKPSAELLASRAHGISIGKPPAVDLDNGVRPRAAFSFRKIPADACLEAYASISFPENREDSLRIDDDYALRSVPKERWAKALERVLAPNEESLAPALPPGIYVVEERIDAFFKRSVLRVRGFDLILRAVGGKALVFAFEPRTGAPREGVEVVLRTRETKVSGKTGPDGLSIQDAAFEGYVVARRGEELQAHTFRASPRTSEDLVYVTTDRPVYRPGHTVSWKAILRSRDGGKLSLGKGGKVQVEVRDPQDRVLKRSETEWDALSTLTGEFRLGDEPPIGAYSVVVHVENRRDSQTAWDETHEKHFWKRTFKVEAYRKPEFKVAVEMAGTGEAASSGRGRKVRATVRADYYFGGPVAAADVTWTAQRRWAPTARRWPRPPFEDPRAWLYERTKKSREDEEDWFQTEDVARGEGKTGPDGTLAVEFEAKDGSGDETLALTADVTDLSRLTASARGEVAARASDLQVKVGATRLFYGQGETIAARARISSPDGKPARGRAVDFAIFATDDAAKEDGGPRQVEYVSFATGTVKTDEQGLASFEARALQGGHVRIRARARDDRGLLGEDRADLWVAGVEAALGPREDGSGGPDERLEILPDRIVHEAGETIRLMARTTVRPLTALLTVEGETLHEARLVRLEQPCQVIEVPVTAAFSPVVHVRLVAWREDRAIAAGYEVCVAPKDGTVDVALSTDRPSYAPHQKAKVKVTTSAGGKPVAADVALFVVDESIYAIEEDRTKDVRRFFHETFVPVAFTIPQGLDSWNPSASVETIDGEGARVRWRGGGAGRSGGMSAGSFSFSDEKKGPPEPDVPAETRSAFKDTLLFAPHVTTGADGKAEVEVEMPDTLTTWRLTARAASGAERFGWSKAQTISRKDVIVRLEAPRFYTERDEGTVGTIVHNDLSTPLSVTVRLKAEGADLDGAERKIDVGSHDVARVDWKLRATRPGTIKLHAEALSKAESDAMEIEVPVRAHGVERHLARAGSVEAAWRETLELPATASSESATLEVVVTGAGLAAVSEALPFLAGYPYG